MVSCIDITTCVMLTSRTTFIVCSVHIVGSTHKIVYLHCCLSGWAKHSFHVFYCVYVCQVYLVTRYLEFLQPELQRLSLGPIFDDIRTSMVAETDFGKEAHHLTTFSDFLDRRGYRSVVTCPYVYRQFSSKRYGQ